MQLWILLSKSQTRRSSNEEIFTAFAVLHGGVIQGGIGEHVVPGWFSTGEDDTLRTPDHVQYQLDYMTAQGFNDLEIHIYPGGHDLGTQEREDVINWWLSK